MSRESMFFTLFALCNSLSLHHPPYPLLSPSSLHKIWPGPRGTWHSWLLSMILIPETPDSDSLSRSGTYVTMLFDDEACCSQAPVLPFSGDSGAVVEQTKLILAAHACAKHTFRVRAGARGWIVDVRFELKGVGVVRVVWFAAR